MNQNDEQIHIENQNSDQSSNHKDKEAPENAKIFERFLFLRANFKAASIALAPVGPQHIIL